MHEENRRLIHAALQLEEGRRAEREAAAVEARERHEQTMHMIRTNNPHHEVIAAMHAGVAGLHQAAQEISSSAAQHRQMAADAGQMFMTAFRQAREALEVATTSSGPPPPPGGGGAVAIQVNVNAAMRPNEVALAGPEPSLTQPLDAAHALEVEMTQTKRAVSAHSVEGNARRPRGGSQLRRVRAPPVPPARATRPPRTRRRRLPSPGTSPRPPNPRAP
jgi:hypothetical protein